MEQRTAEGLEAKKEYIKQYDSTTYDKILFRVPKGEKEEIKAAAARHRMSLNKYITTSIEYYEEHHYQTGGQSSLKNNSMSNLIHQKKNNLVSRLDERACLEA